MSTNLYTGDDPITVKASTIKDVITFIEQGDTLKAKNYLSTLLDRDFRINYLKTKNELSFRASFSRTVAECSAWKVALDDFVRSSLIC